MITIKDFHKGDSCYICSQFRNWDREQGRYVIENKMCEATVLKVGKKYVYAIKNCNKEMYDKNPDFCSHLVRKFSISTGTIKSMYCLDGVEFLFKSEKDYVNYKEHIDLVKYVEKEVKDLAYKLTLEQLRKIKAICEENK